MPAVPKDPTDHEPAAVLRARKRAGLTQEQLAGKLGVSLSLINMIENGSRNATPVMIEKLAGALACNVRTLKRRPRPETREDPAA